MGSQLLVLCYAQINGVFLLQRTKRVYLVRSQNEDKLLIYDLFSLEFRHLLKILALNNTKKGLKRKTRKLIYPS